MQRRVCGMVSGSEMKQSNPKQGAEVTAYIALGSNVGEREQNLHSAITALGKLGTLPAVSSFYETVAVGAIAQPDFLNAVVELRTSVPPLALMTRLLLVELAHGRDRSVSVPKGPRTLDLDLLSYDDVVVETVSLTLPHPALAERLFVLVPLAEIAPEWMHPVRRKTAAQLLAELSQSQPDPGQAVRRIEQHVSAEN